VKHAAAVVEMLSIEYTENLCFYYCYEVVSV